MFKNKTVSARKLKNDDRIVIAGVKYRVTWLNLNFGRGRDRVNVGMHANAKNPGPHINLNVPATATFNIKRRVKK